MAVCDYDVGTLIPIDGCMKSDKYIQILNNYLWPVVFGHFGNDSGIFQEDNAHCHVSRSADQWIVDNDFPV